MKKIAFRYILTLFFLSLLGATNAQNMLNNSEAGFEFNPYRGPNGDCTNLSNPCEFCPKTQSGPNNLTGRWASAHQSPNIFGLNSCVSGSPVSHGGNQHALLVGPPDNRVEGIFIPLTFSSLKYYTISFWAYHGSRINLKLINGLLPDDCAAGNNSPTIAFPPSATDFIILFDDVEVTQSGWRHYEISINPPKNFTQLYFHATQAASGQPATEFQLDDVSVVVSCCEKQAKFQNITDPPSTNRIELIEAGKNVDPSKTQGPVKFTQPWQTVWQVGQLDANGELQGEIVLKDGFESGKNFLAHLEDCFMASLRATLSYTVTTTKDAQQNCLIKLNTVICFGSGRYSVSCKNLNTGATITSASPIDHGTAFNVIPTEETEYEITVIDLDRGDTTVERITIGRCGCIPPKDVPGVNKINNICGASIAPNCFTIGKELQTNTNFKWITTYPNGLNFITDTSQSVTTVCIPPSVVGTGYISYKLITTNPGCGTDTSEFLVYYKRDLSNPNGCFLYSGYHGPNGTGSNDSNRLTVGFNLTLDVDEVFIELHEDGNPVAYRSFDLLRGIDFPSDAIFFYFTHYFFNDVIDNFPYTVVIKYRCRCSSTIIYATSTPFSF